MDLRRPRLHWAAAPARALIIAGLLVALSAYDWPQFGFNSLHNSDNTLETGITPANAHTLGQIFQVSLPGVTDNTADGAPVFLFGVLTSGGRRNLVFVTTRDGTIAALDWRTGVPVWHHQYGPTGCTSSNGGPCYTTSSPVIDPNRQFVYSYGLDGFVHKYRVGDGTEFKTGGWPELATLKPWNEKGSSALGVATVTSGVSSVSYLYVTNGGYPGDAGDYQGHVTAINLSDGTQHVFNAMCSDQPVHFQDGTNPDCPANRRQSAIWARPGVVYDPDTNRIYMATGNGQYDPANHYWGDTVFALKPDATGAAGGNPLDSYTPTNFQDLQDGDADLGSTAPAILPNTSKYPHLAVQSGKDSMLRLINLDNLSGQGGPGLTGGEVFSMSVPQGGEVLTMPAVWVNPSDNSTWVFVANDSGSSGLRLAVDVNGNPRLEEQWTGAAGTSPIVANGVLYVARGNRIEAFDPVSHSSLWHDTSIGGLHWESPIVADGVLYITDESGQLTAYTPGGVVPAPLSNNFLPLVSH